MSAAPALRCDLCGSEDHEHFATKYDLEYRQCTACNFVYADVREFDFEAFNSQTMEGMRDTHLNKHTGSRHQKHYAHMLKQFAPYRKVNRLLEIGCSAGGFLAQVKAAGWLEYGVEPDEGSGKHSRDTLGLNVHLGTLDTAKYASEHFDVIYSNAVIEHIAKPSEVIAEAYRTLRPGGMFYADTVNLDSYTWQFLGKDWKLFDPRMHLSLYTPQTLAQHCEQVGFTVHKIATHGVRFHATREDRPRGWRRVTDELRKTPYSAAARRTHKGDNIAIYAVKPEA